MRKEIIIIGIILLLITSFIIGYFTRNYFESDEESFVPENNTFLLTVSLRKSTYKVNESIDVLLTLRNIGKESISFEPFLLGGNTFFRITNSSGGRIRPGGEDEYGIEKESLGPGQKYSDVITIQELYRIPEPDTYLISAYVYHIGEQATVTYSNNVIEFTVEV